jgi:hypothetical protein
MSLGLSGAIDALGSDRIRHGILGVRDFYDARRRGRGV